MRSLAQDDRGVGGKRRRVGYGVVRAWELRRQGAPIEAIQLLGEGFMKKDQHIYHVYILTNQHHTVLYIGMTGRGLLRIKEHIQKRYDGFTKQYNVNKLVYLERFTEVSEAIEREKQLKKWTRKKKIGLIEKYNSEWEDLLLKAM